MNKKNILHLYSKLTPSEQKNHTFFAGGAQKRVYQLVTHLSEKGHNVYLCSDDSESSLFVEEISQKEITHINIPFRHSLFKKIAGIFKLRKAIKINNIDIIHSNDRLTALFSKIASLGLTVKLVYTARAIFQDKKYIKWFFGENIIAVSNGVKKNLTEYFGISEEKVSVIYNGSEIKHSNEIDRNFLYSKYKLKKWDRILLAIGRLHEDKGHILLLEAIRNIKKLYPMVKLLIVGDGELKEKLKRTLLELGLANNVILCGSQNKVEAYYDICEFTILSSLSEGLPGTVIESMMLGKPVIGTQVGGVPEIIKNKTNGLLVSSKSSEELAKSIIYLLENPQLAARMGKVSKEIIMHKFTLEKMLNSYDKYYEKLSSK